MFNKTALAQFLNVRDELPGPQMPPPVPRGHVGGKENSPIVLLLGPHRDAVSGVSTHLNLLFASGLEQVFGLKHFQVGSEGRNERAFSRALRLLCSPFQLLFRIRAERAAIVHLNTSLNRRAFWRDLAYMLVARLAGASVVYQVHGGQLPQAFAGKTRLVRALLRLALGIPDVIVVLAKCELEAYRNFVPGQDVRLLANAIDYVPYTRLPRDSARPSRELRLLYIGRLSRDKGLYEALHGLKYAHVHGVAARLTIAGSGPEAEGLQQEVQALALSGKVSFVGPVFGEAKLKLFPAADALLFPTHAEGLPYSLLESMAAGVPAITTRVGAIPDVVTEGLHGIFVPTHDPVAIGLAIMRGAANPEWLAHMGVACRRRIACAYSIQRLAREFAQLYREIIGLRQSRAVS